MTNVSVLERKGISLTPEDAGNSIELMFDMPELFRKMTKFMKDMAANDIQIIFKPKSVLFFSVCHSNNTSVLFSVDATKVNHYYCSEELDIGVPVSELWNILSRIKNQYRKIIFSFKKPQKNNQGISLGRCLKVVLDNTNEIEETHKINTKGIYEQISSKIMEDFGREKEYAIGMEMKNSHFKEFIKGILCITGTKFKFSQNGVNDNLRVICSSSNKKILSNYTFKSKPAFKTVLNLENEDSIVSVELNAETLKSISSNQIAEEISLFIDENLKFMTSSSFSDGIVRLQTLTACSP